MLTRIEAKNIWITPSNYITIVEYLRSIKMYRIYFDGFYFDTPTFISIIEITEYTMFVRISENDYLLFKTGDFIPFKNEKNPPYFYKIFSSEEITDYKPISKPISKGDYKLIFPYYLMLSANNIYAIIESNFTIIPIHKFNNTRNFEELEKVIPSKSNHGAYKVWKYFEKKITNVSTLKTNFSYLVNKDSDSNRAYMIPVGLCNTKPFYSKSYNKYRITKDYNKIAYLNSINSYFLGHVKI